MANSSTNTYDLLPYPQFIHPATYPDRLAAVAVTHGLKPAPVAACRVLELGCAAGANIIPMAEGLPASTFVGIDSSARQIENGKQWISELGLANIRLLNANIMEISADLGTFDYIICPGVYSWVSA